MAVILVTGATGFIGSHLVETLLERKNEVRCLIRPESNLRWLPREKVRLYRVDSSTLENFAPALKGAEILFHLAGATKARSRQDYLKHNVSFTRQLLESVKLYAPKLKRFVMTSSQAAAGPAGPGQIMDETNVCRPITYYGESKLAAERLLALFPSIPSVIIRPVSVYGPRDRDVLSLIKLIRRGVAPMIGSPDRRLTFVHVVDLVQSLLLAAQLPQAVGQTYFVSDGRIYTWRETKALIETILQRRSINLVFPRSLVWVFAFFSESWSRVTGIPTIFNLNKVKELVEENWGCSSERLQKELGFKPRYSLDEGLRQTIEWARKAKWL